jgi:hypothetical protein
MYKIKGDQDNFVGKLTHEINKRDEVYSVVSQRFGQ